ncbi:Caspase-7 [Chamberlinius hualienensis]
MEKYKTNGKYPKCIMFSHGNYEPSLNLLSIDAEKHEKLAKETFDCLGFKSYEILRDLTKDEIFNKLVTVTSSDLGNYSSLIVTILTHGGENYYLFAKDDKYNLKELIRKSLKTSHESLKGKPVVFLVEACSGQNYNFGCTRFSGNIRIDYSPVGITSLFLHDYPDLFLSFSSTPDTISVDGIYFPILCGVFQRNYKNMDIVQLLVLTNQKVAKVKRRLIDEKGESVKDPVDPNQHLNDSVLQMPITISTLTKKFYLVQK